MGTRLVSGEILQQGLSRLAQAIGGVVKSTILWFTDDLRLDDNPALCAAARADQLLCVFCVDARFDAVSAYGPRKFGPHRLAFLRQSLQALSEGLARCGSHLHVVAGAPEIVLADLVQQTAADVVHVADSVAPEERATLDRVANAIGADRLIRHESGGLYAQRNLPFALQDMPRVFTRFRQCVERQASIGAPLAAPARLPASPSVAIDDALPGVADWPDTATPFGGGEAAAWARLQHYFWETHAVLAYKNTRNGLQGDYSTRLSPWLAAGCLSPRRVMSELRRFESAVEANSSTYWVGFELHWREFFRWTLARHGARLFQLGGLLQRGDRPAARDAGLIAVWQAGRTGMPFVDANMRELSATGYMSARGRQNAASFLARDLGQDWRVGAAWFESQLVDYDTASNWGNWANIAGVGTDKRDQGFDVLWQAQHYDPEAAYVGAWLPELGGLPVANRHAPFLCPAPARQGVDYPDLAVAVPSHWRS